MAEVDIQKHSVHTLVFRSLKRTHDTFLSEEGTLPPQDDKSTTLRRRVKSLSEYGPVMSATKEAKKQKEMLQLSLPTPQVVHRDMTSAVTQPLLALTDGGPGQASQPTGSFGQELSTFSDPSTNLKALLPRSANIAPKPVWHPPWKLYRVISGHTGWVRCVDVEPGNEWFVTGSSDRIIKIWDLATGVLKLSLTGHISAVRGVKVSHRQPYLFSGGEDKQVKCWDLEYNKVIRHYHGHLSAVQGLSIHPTIDVLLTASRDSTVRVWDMRTKANVHTLTGHTNTVACVLAQEAEPQVLSGSHDATVRLWDLAAGRSRVTLTNHKKSVRAMCLHPSLYMFASASPDNIKEWKCPAGEFVQNVSGHNSIVNALAVNQDSVMVSGGDNGSMHVWDWRSAFCFQKMQSKPQPGSIDSEAGIFALAFDQSGSRLISCEADKSIKMYKEDDTATEESHPLLWRPELLRKKHY